MIGNKGLYQPTLSEVLILFSEIGYIREFWGLFVAKTNVFLYDVFNDKLRVVIKTIMRRSEKIAVFC